MTNQLYERMIHMLEQQTDLLLVGHNEPDSDCLGSLLGLYLAFGGKEKNWRMVTEDQPAAYLDFLPQLSAVVRPQQIDFQPKAVLYVDCCSLNRTGRWLEAYLTENTPVSCIDHHQRTRFQGEITLIESDAAACGEIVAALLQQAAIPPTKEVATALYTALVGDTGCFRFTNTGERTLAQAAWLRPLVDIEQIRIRLYESRSRANMQLLSAALNHLQYRLDGKFCYSWLDRADFAAAGADDASDIVNFTLSTAGVQLGLLLEEYDGYLKVSLRCRSGYRVDQLAQNLGGGGHMQAAGCRLPGTLAQQAPVVLQAVEAYLAQLAAQK